MYGIKQPVCDSKGTTDFHGYVLAQLVYILNYSDENRNFFLIPSLQNMTSLSLASKQYHIISDSNMLKHVLN